MTRQDTKSQTGRIRLNRFLAQAGLGSRRHCDEIISSGRVFVNGVKVTTLGTIVDPSHDRIEYKGKTLQAIRKLEYYAYNKSRGPLVTRSDPEGRETIYDALKKNGHDLDHLRYVGRLDRNSEGLILLTNDGELIHALTHPRFGIKKVYRVRLDKHLQPPDAWKMVSEGVQSQGQTLHAGEIRELPPTPATRKQHWFEVDLYEGKNRQIRRMFEALGYSVERLKRIQLGGIKLDDLPRGQIRVLTPREIRGLLSIAHPTTRTQPRP